MKIAAKIMFMIGILIAAVIGLFQAGMPKFLGLPITTIAFILIGLVVGIFNLKSSKTNNFLITTILLLAVGNAGLLVTDSVFSGVMMNLLAFVGPAAILVAIKAVYEITKV